MKIKNKIHILNGIFKIIFEFFEFDKKNITILIICSIIKGIVPIIYTIVIAEIAVFAIRDDFNNVVIFLLILFSIQIIKKTVETYIPISIEKMKYKITIPLKKKFLKHLVTIDFERRENPDFVRMISRANSALDPDRMVYLIKDCIDAISYAISIIFCFIALAKINLLIMVTNLIILIITSLVMAYSQKYYSNYSKNMFQHKKLEVAYRDCLLTSSKLTELKIFKSVEWMKKKWKNQVNEVNKKDLKGLKKKDMFYLLSMFISGTFITVLSIFIYFQTSNPTVIAVTILIQLSGQTAYLINMLSIIIGTREFDLLLFDDYFSVLRETGKVMFDNKTTSLNSKIEFKNVSFKYETGNFSLDNLNLIINSGESVAIVGENGSGKTTLLNLILGIYANKSGSILINDSPINNIKQAVIFQNFNKYYLTVKENVSFGDINRRQEICCIHDAIQEANISGILSEDGIETELGTSFGGKNISGGEWQRIALARTYFRSGIKIIIWDEPNSSLDPIEENNFLEKMIELTKNKTSIFVTHRLASVICTDKIIMMDKGRIIEFGSHTQLLKKKGKYYEMFMSQANSYQ